MCTTAHTNYSIRWLGGPFLPLTRSHNLYANRKRYFWSAPFGCCRSAVLAHFLSVPFVSSRYAGHDFIMVNVIHVHAETEYDAVYICTHFLGDDRNYQFVVQWEIGYVPVVWHNGEKNEGWVVSSEWVYLFSFLRDLFIFSSTNFLIITTSLVLFISRK